MPGAADGRQACGAHHRQPAGGLGRLCRRDGKRDQPHRHEHRREVRRPIVVREKPGQADGSNGNTGPTIYSSTNFRAGVPNVSSPIAVKGRIIVAANGRFCAWGIPGSPVAAPHRTAEPTKRTIASASHTRG